MALYAIGDLHLSFASDKPMDIFGETWAGHTDKLRESFARLTDDDVTVLCGDLSWAIDLEQAVPDFHFVDELPGKKLILKGNHDYWWSTAAKIRSVFEREQIRSIDLLHNNCHFYGEYAICGTRGWFFEEESGSVHDEKILRREIGRLETSLKAAGEREKLVFLHYPPKYLNYACDGILELFERYGVRRCWYGHLHGPGRKWAYRGEHNGTTYSLVSADEVDFCPEKILD